MTAPSRLICRVESIDNVTHDIRRVRLIHRDGEQLPFRAGQYASVTFPDQPARDYSFASLPGESFLEFHVRRMSDGSTSHFVADGLRPGDEVVVEGPLGACYLRDDHPGPILAIAGGSGLAPIRSIVETALKSGFSQPVNLYFGARDEHDIYMEENFRALAAAHAHFRYVPVLSEPSGETERRTGFVHQAVLSDFAELAGYAAYLAGPPAMVEAALPALRGRGMLAEHIFADAFYDAHLMESPDIS